ncbi:MAG: isochorismatase family protein [Deltaproteobacteria bacterium]|nr:isochorismatase family protein [Deltaproteobacteria bacterium]
MKNQRVKADSTIVVCVDWQEKLVAAMPPEIRAANEAKAVALLKLARGLEIPVVASEQYPQGLGHTVPALLAHIDKAKIIEKTCFGCGPATGFDAALSAAGARKAAIVIGMEAHVCVHSTVLDLIDRGFTVHLVRDAVLSRTKANFKNALDLARDAGATVTNAETVIFQLLGTSTHPLFRDFSKLVRDFM